MKLTKVTDVSQLKPNQLVLLADCSSKKITHALVVGVVEQHWVYFESPVDRSKVWHIPSHKFFSEDEGTLYIVEQV